MTTDIFRKYIKRLNASFRYAERNVAILVDNASVHKLKEEFSNIKLIFLPANTTSKLQPLDADSSSNYSILLSVLMANHTFHRNHCQFRLRQYYRAVNKYLAGVSLDDHIDEYRMDEVDALFFLADSWIKVKPQTVRNCWDHAKIFDCKFADKEKIESEDTLPTFELPLDDDLVNQLNEIIPDLPGNRSEDGNKLVAAVEELDLNADESDLIVFHRELVEFDEVDNNAEVSPKLVVDEEAEESSDVNMKETREELKRAYETILYHTIAMDERDGSLLKRIRQNLDDIRTEEVAEKKQTDLRVYF